MLVMQRRRHAEPDSLPLLASEGDGALRLTADRQLSGAVERQAGLADTRARVQERAAAQGLVLQDGSGNRDPP